VRGKTRIIGDRIDREQDGLNGIGGDGPDAGFGRERQVKDAYTEKIRSEVVPEGGWVL